MCFSNVCVFLFAGFWILWLQPHKHRKCNCAYKDVYLIFLIYIYYIYIIYLFILFLCASILMLIYFAMLEFIAKCVLFLITVFLCFLQISQFCDYNHTNIASAIVSCRDVYLFFLMSFIYFVVCIDFNVGLFCFAKCGVHFQFVFYGIGVCVVATTSIIL